MSASGADGHRGAGDEPAPESEAGPWAVPEVPGVAFRARSRPEDFVVHEVRRADTGGLSGDGTHVHFEIEKRGIDTAEAVRRLARALDRRPGEFGRAGRKDALGVTRQALSLEHVEPEQVLALNVDDLRVLGAERRDRKLKPGQLLGNDFQLVLRDVEPGGQERLERVLERLVEIGLPNRFGPQRFGRTGEGGALGALLLVGDVDAWLARVGELYPPRLVARARGLRAAGRSAAQVLAALPRDLAELHLSATVAEAFNAVLGERLGGRPELGAGGGPGSPPLGSLTLGDLAWRHADGAVFRVAEPAAEASRAATFELSPSGPLAGERVDLAGGDPGAVEREHLAARGLDPASWAALPRALRPSGARRPLRVPVENLDLRRAPDGGLQLAFRLPKGAFATALLAELAKGRAPLG